MSGPSAKYVYTDDSGTARAVTMPVWEAVVSDFAAVLDQGQTPATTEPALPRGVQRRKRYYRITATGKEGSLTVLDPVSNVWTAAAGTAILIPLFNSAVVANNATLEGRTGERMRHI